MILHRTAFHTYGVIIPRNVHLVVNNDIKAIKMESNFVKKILESIINQICAKDVPHVPILHANLFLVSKCMSNGMKVEINLNECMVNHAMMKSL